MKPKMKLDDLKIKSFVTNVDKEAANTAKGGSTPLPILLSVAISCSWCDEKVK